MMCGCSARWRAWIACLAAVLGLAAPGSGVSGHAHAGNWQEICAAGGSRLVRIAEQGLPPESIRTQDDCACCVGAAPALPALRVGHTIPAQPGRDLLPVAARVHVSRMPPWSGGRPRAPPLVLV